MEKQKVTHSFDEVQQITSSTQKKLTAIAHLPKFKPLTLILLLFLGLGYGNMAVAQVLLDFNNTSDLTSKFNPDATPVFTNINDQGIGNSGSINVPIGSSDIWTTKAGYSVTGAGDVYTLSAFFKIKANSGYGGLGFSSVDVNEPDGYGSPEFGLGMCFHGGGGYFINNKTPSTVNWPPDLVIGNWYKMILKVTAKGSSKYDLNFQIWNSDANGTLGVMKTEQIQTNVVNTNIGSASTIHVYFSAAGSRMEKIDNFYINLEGGAVIIPPGQPVIITNSASSVASTTATCGGNVTDDNGAAVTARGVCWSTSSLPTILDSKTTDGSGTGTFTSFITGLSGATTYYVRAYATNTAGTSYGAPVSFTTSNTSLTVTATSGTLTANYITLKEAFDAINAGTHKGNIQIKINQSTIETASAVLNASGTVAASYTSVNIYPTVTGLSITGNIAAPMIDLNGADNVTIDGRVNAAGTTKDLIVSNTSVDTTAGTSTIRLINDASTNTIKYCNVKGSSLAALGKGGIVYLSTGTTTGNNSNTIDNCNITNAAGFRPLEAVCSNGTSTVITNNNFTVSNSYIYDFFNAANNSYGVYTSNSNACSVTSNSFYETTSFAATANVSQNVIYINTGGGNHNVSNNYIGGNTNTCGGAAMTKTDILSSDFYGIWVDGNTTASNVQGNTVRNINWKSIGDFFGMYLNTGLWNIGTTTGNTIGSGTGTGSIVFTNGSNYPYFYGIYDDNSNSGSLAQNNIIGSITTSNTNAGNATDFCGIWCQLGFCVYSSNLIGSLTTTNSINASSASTASGQRIIGLMGNAIGNYNNNTVANMFNACTNSNAQTMGMWGILYAKNNIIHDLYGSGGTGAGDNASVIGIKRGTLSSNLIYNLFNSGSNTNVIGIVASGNGDVKNNVVRIDSTTSNSSYYGIWDNTTGTQNIYHNSVYIGGNVASVNNANSAAFVSANNGARNYRNNIFVNARSNTAGGTGKNYAAMVTSNTTLTMNYNDYYVSGTGGVFGSFNSVDAVDLVAWKTAVGQDANSINANPLYANPTAVVPNLNLTLGSLCEGAGISIPTVTTDFLGQLRSSFTPTDMGAYCGDFAIVPVVTSVSVPANATYIAGQNLDFTVNFSEVVTVVGVTPSIPVTLNTGGTVAATYISGTGTSALVFRYTVVTGKADPDGIVVGTSIALNGATIKSATSVSANLTLNSVGITTGVLVDAIAPTCSITMSDYALKIGETAVVTITFSETVTGFTNADLTIVNGTLTAVSSVDGGITWTATFTPTVNLEDATNIITLDKTGITDLASNPGVGTTSSLNYAIDTKAPTVVSITLSDYALKIGETSIVTFTFSEAVISFSNADITVANGALTAVNSSDGGVTWTGTFTPTTNLEDATNIITLDNTGYTDIAGNPGSGTTNSLNYTIDTKAPTVLSIVRVNTNPTFATSADFTVSFSESVTGVDVSDFSLTTTGTATGTISAISGSGSTYTVTVSSISGVGDIRLDLNNGGTGIADITTNPIATGYTGGQSYTLYQLSTVTTNAASIIGSTTATLNGTVNANNNSTVVTFEYGTSIAYGTTVTAVQSPVTGTSGTAVNYSLSSLIPFTTYHYRAVGVNGAGTTNGLDETFTTSQGALTITVPTLTTSKVYDGNTTASVTIGTLIGLDPSDVGNVTVSAVANYDDANVGTNKTITVVYTIAGSASYKYTKPADYVILTGAITPKNITVTVNASQTKVYGQVDPTLFTYTSSDLAATFTGSLTRVAGENVGNYAINLGTLAVDANWNISSFTSADFSITPKNITVTVNASQTKVFGQTDPTPFTYTSSDLLATFTGLLTRNAGENVGNYAINQGTLAVDANWNISSFTSADFSITPKNITVTATAGQTKVYGQVDPTPFTYTSSDLAATFTGSLTRDVGENFGNYAINQGSLVADANWNISTFNSADFSITPKNITVIVNVGQTKVYGQVDPTPFTYTSSDLAATFTGSLTRDVGENFGNYTINQGNLVADANWNISTFNSADFSITPKNITVTVNAGQTKVYGQVDPTLFTYTSSDLAATFTGLLTRNAGENVGNYAINVGTLAVGSNWNISSFTGADFSITPKNITVTVNAGQVKVYGQVDPTPFTYTSSDLAATFTGSLTRVSGENVGNYAINLGTLAVDANWNISTFNSADFSITPKNITVIVNVGQTKVYGQVDPTPFTYTSNDLAATFTGSLTRDVGENFGNYTINQGNLVADANWNISTFNSADFSITPKNITVTVNAGQTKVYGQVDPTLFTYTSSDLAATFTGLLTRNAGENVANYAINVGTLAVGSNWNISTFTSADFSITPKPLTVSGTLVTTIKIYDGNTTAEVTNNGTLSGVETSDIGNVNFTVAADYDNAQAGLNKIITVVYSLNGTAASNYNAPVSYQINGTTIYSPDPPTLVLTTNAGCQGDMVDLNYTILTGTPVEYQIMFNQAALNAGFANVSFTALPSANISDIIQFMAPAGVVDGNYAAEVKFRNMYGVESQVYPINFVINLSSDYIIPKFSDVVLCNNVDNRFVSYQWYKNGSLIPGATNQFYNDPTGLNGAYSLTVVTTSGETLKTCEKVLTAALNQQPLVNVFPNPVSSSQDFMVEIDNLSNIDLKGAVMILYNIKGEVVYTSNYVEFQNRINLSANGEYHGVIKTLDGKTLSYKVVIIK